MIDRMNKDVAKATLDHAKAKVESKLAKREAVKARENAKYLFKKMRAHTVRSPTSETQMHRTRTPETQKLDNPSFETEESNCHSNYHSFETSDTTKSSLPSNNLDSYSNEGSDTSNTSIDGFTYDAVETVAQYMCRLGCNRFDDASTIGPAAIILCQNFSSDETRQDEYEYD